MLARSGSALTASLRWWLWSAMVIALVSASAVVAAQPAVGQQSHAARPTVELLAPTTAIPALAQAGDTVEVTFAANRAWPYVLDVRASGSSDGWMSFDGDDATGTATRGDNAVEVVAPASLEPGDHDVRVRLLTPGGGRIELARDTAEAALHIFVVPTTGFEDRGGDGWTTHSEELDFLAVVADLSERVTYTQIGESVEGRPLHLVRVGHPQPPSDADIAAGRSVLIIGSQHGNEPAGREMALQLSRDLAFTDDPQLLDQLGETAILFIPSANPDGREANSRTNAMGVDTNRDHLHMATPEGAAIGQVLRDFTPDISIDAHERPSGSNPDMELLWPRNLNVDAEVHALSQEMVEDYVWPDTEAEGFTVGLYGSPGGAGGEDERISRNAIGLRHGLGMLTESGGADPPTYRVDAQLASVHGVLRFHRERTGDIAAAVTEAPDRKATAGANQSEPFYLAGADNWPPQPDDILDPPPCGYVINTAQADDLARPVDLFPLMTEQVSDTGVFVTMGQPMMTVVPLLLDERAVFNMVEGIALDDCSDPGSVEPPPLPPDPTPPAQHQTDFAADVVGEPPADWTPMWNSSSWTVLDDPTRLQHVVDDDGGRRSLTWDAVGDDGHVQGDVEVFGLVRVPPPMANTRLQMTIHISGDASNESAYYLDAQGNNVRVNRYLDGVFSGLGSAALPFTVEADTWYRVVLQREGTTLRAKMWPDGDDEPDAWQVTTADATFDGGRVGMSHFTPGAVNDWAFYGVGTGGEPAPRAPDDLVEGAS